MNHSFLQGVMYNFTWRYSRLCLYSFYYVLSCLMSGGYGSRLISAFYDFEYLQAWLAEKDHSFKLISLYGSNVFYSVFMLFFLGLFIVFYCTVKFYFQTRQNYIVVIRNLCDLGGFGLWGGGLGLGMREWNDGKIWYLF